MTDARGRRITDPDYGLGEHEIDCRDLELLDEEALTARLVRAFTAPGYKPPRLPKVAMELMALSQNPDVEYSEVERLLEQDPVLAGEILSAARSAFFSGTRPVASLREALVRLGLSNLRRLVMQASVNLRVFRSRAYGGCMDRVREHSRVAAHMARIVALHTSLDEEQAFLCGLLHDVGFAGILIALGDVKREERPPSLTGLWPAIHAAHPTAGEQMTKRWGLPPEIGMVVGAHHQIRIHGYDHPLAAAVCLGEELAIECDHGLAPRRGSPPPARRSGLPDDTRIDKSDEITLARAREALSLGDGEIASIRAEAERWVQQDRRAAAPA